MNHRARRLALFCSLLLLGTPARGQEAPGLPELLDAQVRPAVEEAGLVGLVVGVLRGDERAVRGYGRLHAESEQAPDGTTLFEIGSITKVFTGVALASLVEEGRLKLEQPLSELLPDVQVPEHEGQPIRLVHLATHTSGLPRLPGNMRPANILNPYADYTIEQAHAFLATCPLSGAPGTKAAYSNYGMGLLGDVLARSAETSYEALVVERIAAPLGMVDTGITLSEAQRARLAPGHRADGKPLPNWDLPALAGAGALRSNVDDMLRFAAACLDPPDTPLGRALARAQQVHHRPAVAGQPGLGLAWHLLHEGRTLFHNGQTGGYHGTLLVVPAQRLALVVLANCAHGRVDRIAFELLEQLE